MIMTDPFPNSPGSSQFTRRHLELLGESSPESPLRVIALVDYDAFYAQCETVRLGLPPTEPLAVRQWNAVIAINYPARAYGLKRGMSVEEVTRQCPNLTLQHIATWREGDPTWAYRPDVIDHLTTDKAALDPYRLESRKTLKLVKDLLPTHPPQRIEKASVDEFFIDLSGQVHNLLLERFPELSGLQTEPDERLPLPESSLPLLWPPDELTTGTNSSQDETIDWDDISLNIGAEIVRNIRHRVRKDLGYTCSAGIGRNKVLAKLASGYRKPNRQTVVRERDIASFLGSYKATKIQGLAGKLGANLTEKFGSDSIRDLLQISRKDMISGLGSEKGEWVFDVIRGREISAVVRRTQIQSMLSAKTFVPHLKNIDEANRWLRIFAADLKGRLDDVNSELDLPLRPRTIAVNHHIKGRFGPTRSKQMTISPHTPINPETLFALSKVLLKKVASEEPSWPCMGISVRIGNFSERTNHGNSIASFFKIGAACKRAPSEELLGQNKLRKLDELPGNTRLGEPASSGLEEPVERWEELDQCSEGPDITAGENDLPYQCPKCGIPVAADDVLEHLDWHVALEVQNCSQRSE